MYEYWTVIFSLLYSRVVDPNSLRIARITPIKKMIKINSTLILPYFICYSKYTLLIGCKFDMYKFYLDRSNSPLLPLMLL